MMSVNQSASKLLAVKVVGLKKKSAVSAYMAEVYASAFGPSLISPWGSFNIYVNK